MWVYNEIQQQDATRKFLWTIFRQVFHVWETKEKKIEENLPGKRIKLFIDTQTTYGKWKTEKKWERKNDARAKRVKLNQKFSNFKSNLLILVMQISPRERVRKRDRKKAKKHLHNKPMLFFHLGIYLFFIKAIFSFS